MELPSSDFHPILGQGPYYGEIPGYEAWWPHNLYLFVANLVGYPGLLFFLIILYGLWVYTWSKFFIYIF